MKNSLKRVLLTAISACVLFIASSPAKSDDNNAMSGHALLIGIDQYQNFPSLNGAINDVEMIRQILLSRWGFHESDVKVMRDKDATAANILAAVQKLNDQGPGLVYIHFSGYGSLVRDGNNRLTETILSSDARSEGIADIAVHDLETRLRSLQNVLLVLDTSHSTAGSRSASRAAAIDTRMKLYAQTLSSNSLPPSIVVISAAEPRQLALEAPIEGRYHGVLSYALGKTLLTINQHASPKDMFASIEGELRRLGAQLGLHSMAQPQLDGADALLNRPVFASVHNGREEQARIAWISARPLPQGRVLLHKGQLMGALPGSAWAMYPPGDSDLIPGQASAIAIVSDVAGIDSIARLEPSNATIENGARAVAIAPPSASGLSVRLEMPPDRRAKLEASLRDSLSGVQFVGKNDFARFVVEQQGETVLVSGGNGMSTIGAFPATDDSRLSKQLVKLFTRSSNATNLVALDNPSSNIRIDARVAALSAGMNVNLVASDRLNLDRSGGNPLSMRVWIYQLANKGKLEQATYQALLKNDQKFLEGDMLWKKEIVIHPNSREVIQVDPHKDAQYVAVVGLFRDPQGQAWRYIIPAKELSQGSVELNIEAKSIKPLSPEQLSPTRHIKRVANVSPSRVRIRKEDEPRTHENSLQLEIKSNCDCYITIVDVDSEGGINLLFPTPDQKEDYYPQGKIRANETVLLPDSLGAMNKAGFHFDYAIPPGIDTIRVFASTDLQTAEMIRRHASNPSLKTPFPAASPGHGTTVQSPATQNDAPVIVASASFDELRRGLRTRGVKTVPNKPERQSGSTTANPIGKPDSNQDHAGATVLPVSHAPDWAATSLTVVVDP